MGVRQNGQTPSIIEICSYCELDRPVFEQCQTLLHPELTPWWSFLLADGAHHKKPHSPTHPNPEDQGSLFIQISGHSLIKILGSPEHFQTSGQFLYILMWFFYAFGTLEVKMSCYKIWPAETLQGMDTISPNQITPHPSTNHVHISCEVHTINCMTIIVNKVLVIMYQIEHK